jgi:DeoR/GlpR family transcriptional regulator of sugar metabolism
MKTNPRHDQIIALLAERGLLSVAELSQMLDVSEMTIRRDLELLDRQKRIRRTYGGAIPLPAEGHNGKAGPAAAGTGSGPAAGALLVDQVDVLIATSVSPYYDRLLIDQATKKDIPIIAESVAMACQCTVVAVDNYQAGFDLGLWTGQHLGEWGIEAAHLLDLTFHQPNTETRSRGFVAGLSQACPNSEVTLSIDSQSRYATSYQLVRDTLSVYRDINVIFAINDITAWGAINACRDLAIDPARMVIVPFGLEGDTLKNELMANRYVRGAVAMFPEIVSLTCIEAAIAAYRREPQPQQYVTPHAVLTPASLPEYYTRGAAGWQFNWDFAQSRLRLPARTVQPRQRAGGRLPAQIGLIVPFVEHDWYKNLTALLQEQTRQYGIGLQIIDAGQNARDEVEIRRRQIALAAAGLVQPGDVVLVDSGPIAQYLALALKDMRDLTVITNSVVVFDTLNRTPGLTLISTGGALRSSSQTLVGPTAEGALKELHADKLFLMVSGITLDFGLSHHTISEVTIKQAMLRSAREVILLADHTAFGVKTGVQVAPLSVVHRLVTDDALPPSTRLDISRAGIQLQIV